MKLKAAGRKAVIEYDDGRIHGPFSLYLNESTNANTRSSIFSSLTLLHHFLVLQSIQLADRAATGRCLENFEIEVLADLAFRPLAEVHSMDTRKLKRYLSSIDSSGPDARSGAVLRGTASQRVDEIAGFLEFFRRLIDPSIASRDLREMLASSFKTSIERLRRAVPNAPGGNGEIRSVPGPRYMEIMKAIYCRPADVFCGDDGPTRSLNRDRAMALLAAEGLRPGEIGNLRINDIYNKAGDVFVSIQSNLQHRKKITSSTPRGKGLSSSVRRYSTQRTIKLWPWTAAAISDYQAGERRMALRAVSRDRTNGFLFLKGDGKPITSRRTIGLRFEVAEVGLERLGLLGAVNDPRRRSNEYDFSAYVLRHSAASFFYETKVNAGEDPNAVKDQMRARFGWSATSDMPQRYANRAIRDRANLTLQEFWRELRAEAKSSKPNGRAVP
jgi:integrase